MRALLLFVAILLTLSANELDRVDALLERVVSHSETLKKSYTKREADLDKRIEDIQKRIRLEKRALKSLQKEAKRVKKRFEKGQKELKRVDSVLMRSKSALFELNSLIHESAKALQEELDGSLLSYEFSRYEKLLEGLSARDRTPSIEEIQSFAKLYKDALYASGGLHELEASIYDSSGIEHNETLWRLGMLSAFGLKGYLHYDSELNEWRYSMKTSDRDIIRALKQGEGFVSVGIDTTPKSLFEELYTSKGIIDYIDDGGVIGYLIVILFVIALLLILYKWLYLLRVQRGIKGYVDGGVYADDNPLYKVVVSLQDLSFKGIEQMQMVVQSSVDSEIFFIERGLGFIKLIAAIAPLMGLLGTVSGMIETFEALSMGGSANESSLMAEGISHALVTTLLGLVVAIVTLFLHAALLSKSRAIIAFLDAEAMRYGMKLLKEGV